MEDECDEKPIFRPGIFDQEIFWHSVCLNTQTLKNKFGAQCIGIGKAETVSISFTIAKKRKLFSCE